MADSTSWVDQQQRNSLFRGAGNALKMAARLLELGPTNRRINEKQARLLMYARMLQKDLEAEDPEGDWSFLERACVLTEQAQLTVGPSKNSRDEFAGVVEAELRAQAQQQRMQL